MSSGASACCILWPGGRTLAYLWCRTVFFLFVLNLLAPMNPKLDVTAYVIFTLRFWGGPFLFHHDNNPVHTQSEVHSGFFQVLHGWIWPAWDTFSYLFNYSFLLESLSNIIRVVHTHLLSSGLVFGLIHRLLVLFEAALPPSSGLNGSLLVLCPATWLHHCLRL